MESTLVLNLDNSILDIQPLRKAIKKVYKEKAEVLETYVDDNLKTWEDAMRAPAVIRLLYLLKIPNKGIRILPLSRKNIWLRDQGKCQYCNKFLSMKDMHWDHVIPQDQGGKSTWVNLVCCDLRCNSKKANRTPEQAGMVLLKKPVAPKYVLSKEKEMILRLKSLKNFPHEAWKNYIYWNIELDS